MTDTAATDPATAALRARQVACDAFEPIAWSTFDTDATILAVKAHNAAYKALCGHK